MRHRDLSRANSHAPGILCSKCSILSHLTCGRGSPEIRGPADEKPLHKPPISRSNKLTRKAWSEANGNGREWYQNRTVIKTARDCFIPLNPGLEYCCFRSCLAYSIISTIVLTPILKKETCTWRVNVSFSLSARRKWDMNEGKEVYRRNICSLRKKTQ